MEPAGLNRSSRMQAMVALSLWLKRTSISVRSDGESMANRDRCMFQIFEWLQNRLSKKHKTIVWAATVHIAKQGDSFWGGTVQEQILAPSSTVDTATTPAHWASLLLRVRFRQGKGQFPAPPVAPADFSRGTGTARNLCLRRVRRGKATRGYCCPSRCILHSLVSNARMVNLLGQCGGLPN